MNQLMLYSAVFIGSATPVLEVWLAVPLGVLAGLPWLPTALVGFLGNFITLLPVIYAGDKINLWIKRWYKKPPTEGIKNSTMEKSRKRVIFDRLGLPGLAFLGPFLIGVHAASAFAIASGSNKRDIVFWFSASILIFSIVFAILADMGLASFVEERSLPSLTLAPNQIIN
ncbi:small multi-drug export protein [Halomonas huangheensis]|uniref:small multi-drug export protein n=1 Tax=Halomonas huangheensis TaxID=1178482 RepID=UPI0009DBF56D|nr:small multi-drug export protein [Halomonas huangheensis]